MPRLATLTCLALLLASCHKEEPAPKAGIAWGKSIDDATARAKTSGKPVLLHFYAPW